MRLSVVSIISPKSSRNSTAYVQHPGFILTHLNLSMVQTSRVKPSSQSKANTITHNSFATEFNYVVVGHTGSEDISTSAYCRILRSKIFRIFVPCRVLLTVLCCVASTQQQMQRKATRDKSLHQFLRNTSPDRISKIVVT